MSSIKLSPNASGTGEFTIAAPNSNTNRTLTLPDQTGTVLTNAGPFTANASASAGAVTIDASNNVGIGTSSPQRKLDVTVNDTTTAQLYLRNNNASYASGFIVYNAGGEASIFRHNGGSDTSYGGANSVNIGSVTNNVVAFIQNNGEAARIDGSRNFVISGSNTFYTNTASFSNTSGTGKWQNNRIELSAATTVGQDLMYFRNANGIVGAVGTVGSSTYYNTSSDYRLKHDIQPMTGALARVAALKPVKYKWNSDDSNGEGFIAHELQAVVPQCVTGEKDAVDENGDPKYQGIDTSFLVATLTAAIQELNAKVEAQAAEIAALKGAQ
jgi:hypothetical protein